MKGLFVLIIFVCSTNSLEIKGCRKNNGDKDNDLCKQSVDFWLQDINKKALEYYKALADYTWNVSMDLENPTLVDSGALLDQSRTSWRNKICETVSRLDEEKLEDLQKRQFYILCRSPAQTPEESEALNTALGEMQTIYTTSKVCIWKSNDTGENSDENLILSYLNYIDEATKSYEGNPAFDYDYERNDEAMEKAVDLSSGNNLNKNQMNVKCFSGEPDLEKLMSESQNERVLKWAWLSWRKKVGPLIRPHFQTMVKLKNQAAVRNGYANLAEVWQSELEMENLEELSWKLLSDIMPLYIKLHRVVGRVLRKKYPKNFKKIRDAKIPAHLLGNMWSQNWGSLYSLILPEAGEMGLDRLIKRTNWTTLDMVKRAEDFYTSISLSPMTKKFWKYSYFGKNDNRSSKCHGTAANMFDSDDYRMIYCAGLSMDDFYVIHHELGHIEYYMSYDKNLPTLLREGVNSAFQESIGDAIMYGVLSPQHLNRLRIIEDQLINPETREGKLFDKVLLLQIALIKLPQIPFGYLIDKYRWDVFASKIKPENYNSDFWQYAELLQGIVPPDGAFRGEDYFDIAAKFHVPDNTPYIRYFLSSFIQMQIFKGLCQINLFGHAHPDLELPMPLHRCDIYGSKSAGRQLKGMMSKGSSIHWTEALFMLTGDRSINSRALLEYFAPLHDILEGLDSEEN